LTRTCPRLSWLGMPTTGVRGRWTRIGNGAYLLKSWTGFPDVRSDG